MGKRTDRSTRSSRRATVRRRLLVEHLGDRRVLAAITGAVFEDANFSFHRDADEVSLASRLIYIDANDNATLDTGERFVVAEEDGTFAFENLADGTYSLRLFNGTQTQQQTTPIEATVDGETVVVNGNSSQLLLSDGAAIALTSTSVVLGDLDTGVGRDVSVATEVTKMQTLPDGTLLVIGTDQSGDTAWIVDPANASVTAVNLAGTTVPIQWSDVAIDGSGHGVLVEHSASASTIHRIDASDLTNGIQVSSTATTVQSDTQVLTSETGSRSVFASSVVDGLEFRLWSNSTATLISDTPINITGTQEMLAYDDASGLLALRTFDGGVSIHDVNQDFATLHTLSDVTGPVAIDGVRDLLLTVSPFDAVLRLIDIRDGALIADLAVDLSTVGQVASLAIGDDAGAVVVLGAAGMTEIALNKAAANRVTIAGGQDVDAILFGVSLHGNNTAPEYITLPEFTTAEDAGFTKPAPAALAGAGNAQGAVDAQDDQFVLVQRGPAANGFASISIDGGISYTPNPDFFGVDTVPVVLHDGEDMSAEFKLQITVTPVPDSPTDIEVVGDPIPENIVPRKPVADIEVIDVDFEQNHLIQIQDPRFEVIDGQIIFVNGFLDFELEPIVSLTITVTDPETNESIERIVNLRVGDENDPITSLNLVGDFVAENEPGARVGEISVEDADVGQTITLTVDDDRFEVVGTELRLKPDVALDFEADQSIIIEITADDGAGSSLSKEFTIRVGDISEQPESLTLSNHSVMELKLGDVVGDVFVDGNSPHGRFVFTVDDSRFEVDGNTLKLLDDRFVERASQDEIQLSITAEDSDGEFASISETFIILVEENLTPAHNEENPYDVDHNLQVTSLDVLLVINYLNTYGPGPVGDGDLGYCYDVNADGFITALDALLILNELHRLQNGGGTVGTGEGERISNDQDDVIAPDENADDDSSDDSNHEEVFTDWGDADGKIGDSGIDDQPAAPARQPLDSPSGSSPSQEFADRVDQTLGLLSDSSE